MDIIIIVIILVICCCCCILVGGGGYYYINFMAPNDTQAVPNNTQAVPNNTQTAPNNTQTSPNNTQTGSTTTQSPTQAPISYITFSTIDQDGQTIKSYKNNNDLCKQDCTSNNDCTGYITNTYGSCWNIKSFPSPYINQNSTMYKKSNQQITQTPSYLPVYGLDQDGQTIKKFINNNDQCKQDCTSNNNCTGYITNTDGSCWNIKSFPSSYKNQNSTIYKKGK